MTASAIPAFTARQTPTHVVLEVSAAACPAYCSPRAVVDGGNVFGLACVHLHLPLVFPDRTLVDGSSKLGDGQASSIGLSRAGNSVSAHLLKQREGEHVGGLDGMKPSVFPLLEEDEEGRDEERLVGLEMLQRGVQAMKSQGLMDGHGHPSKAASTSAPRPPCVPEDAKTKVHECFGNGPLDADEISVRRVAAYEFEEKQWDEGIYLDNFIDEDGEVAHLVTSTLPLLSTHRDDAESKPDSDVASEEQGDMSLLLLEVLLAQAYDYRTTAGEATVESAWTIAVLCRSLVTSCLPSVHGGDTVLSVLVGSMRRQLSLPLYRSWVLSIQVANDVVSTLRHQRARAMLAQVQPLFDEGEDEAMATYSADVITPLLQSFDTYFSPASLSLLSDQLDVAVGRVSKGQVGGNWDMEELEAAAKEAVEEGVGGYV